MVSDLLFIMMMMLNMNMLMMMMAKLLSSSRSAVRALSFFCHDDYGDDGSGSGSGGQCIL